MSVTLIIPLYKCKACTLKVLHTIIMSKHKRTELTLSQKVELIKKSNGRSQRSLADEFNIGKTQVLNVLKRKAEYLTAWEDNEGNSRKRLCTGMEYEEVNTLTWQWFQKTRSASIPVSGPMLQEQALQFADRLGKTDFKASNGWLNSFKSRHNLTGATLCGERASVDPNVVDDWLQRVPTIIKEYSPRDIYNADETGLFYRALPDKTLKVRGEDCKGGKQSKLRLTAMLCCNMAGEHEKVLIIGKAAKPRCFKNVNPDQLPVTWRANKKSWMAAEIFSEWLRAFDKKMQRQKRHVLLFVDNAPSHPSTLRLTNVKLLMLPANTTSQLQPLDQGIIQTLKLKYRKRLLRHVLLQLSAGKSSKEVVDSVTVLDACHWISSAMKEIQQSTIMRCFAKCGMERTDEHTDTDSSEDDDDVPLARLIEQLRDHDIADPLSARDYADIDSDVPVNDSMAPGWEDRLVDDFIRENRQDSDSEDEEHHDPPAPVKPATTSTEALRMLDDLCDYCLENDVPGSVNYVNLLRDAVQQHSLRLQCSTKQTTMDFYLK